MSAGDIILSDGTTITPEDLQKIAAAVENLIGSTAKDPGQYEEVQSLTGISSLPVFQVLGNTYKLVRVAVSVLKGVDGREVSLQVTKDYIQWRYTDGNWQNLIAIADLKGAAGETPVFRTGSSGIEWKYVSEPDTAYRSLVSYDVLKLKFSDLTTEQIQEFWEAIPADLITLFQKPATDAAAEVRNEMDQISEAASIAINNANDAAANANKAAENVQDGVDGKTPVLESVSAISGETPSGSFSQVGVDESGNPKYILNLTLPKGKNGQPAVFEAGTTTTLAPSAEASVEVVPNGETPNGNPKYILNFFIPRGETGLPGAGSGNVSAEGAGLVAGKKYFFVPDASDSTSGRFVEYVDGPGSGIDADLLDGKQGSDYMLAKDAGKFVKTTGVNTITTDTNDVSLNIKNTNNNPRIQFVYKDTVTGTMGSVSQYLKGIGITNRTTGVQFGLHDTYGLSIYDTAYRKVWHEANDGSGSGLDADLLDGKQGSEYALKTEIPDAIPDAPADGKTYGRKNEAWVEIVGEGSVIIPDSLVTLFIQNKDNIQAIPSDQILMALGGEDSFNSIVDGVIANRPVFVQYDVSGMPMFFPVSSMSGMIDGVNIGFAVSVNIDLSVIGMPVASRLNIIIRKQDGEYYADGTVEVVNTTPKAVYLDLTQAYGADGHFLNTIPQSFYDEIQDAYNNKITSGLMKDDVIVPINIIKNSGEYIVNSAMTMSYGGVSNVIKLVTLYVYSDLSLVGYEGLSTLIIDGNGTEALMDNGDYKRVVLLSPVTMTSLTNIPISTYSIAVTLSAASALSFASTPAEGWECMIDIKNSSSSNITQPLPNASGWQCDDTSITIASGKIASISVRYIHGTYVVIAKGN